jgi:hypothetical protein
VLDERKDPAEEQLFKEFGYNKPETDWLVGGFSLGGFSGLRMRLISATFHWVRK